MDGSSFEGFVQAVGIFAVPLWLGHGRSVDLCTSRWGGSRDIGVGNLLVPATLALVFL